MASPSFFPGDFVFVPPFFSSIFFGKRKVPLPAPPPQRCRSEVVEAERKNKLFHSILSPRRLLPFSSQRERRRTLFLQKRKEKVIQLPPLLPFLAPTAPFPLLFYHVLRKKCTYSIIFSHSLSFPGLPATAQKRKSHFIFSPEEGEDHVGNLLLLRVLGVDVGQRDQPLLPHGHLPN